MTYTAMILAAGRGTRLSGGRGKAFIELASCPMLWHGRAALRAMKNPPRRVVIVCHEDDKARMDKDKDYSADVIAVQPTLKGTADAVKTGLAALDGGGQEPILILPTDMPLITSAHLDEIVAAAAHNCGVLSVMTPRNNHGYGRVLCDEANKPIAIIEEKDCTDKERAIPLVYAGVMMANAAIVQSAVEAITPSAITGEYYLTQLVSLLAKQGDYAFAYVKAAEEIVQGVNDIHQWQQAEHVMQQRLRARAAQHGVLLPQPDHVVLAADTQWDGRALIHPFVFMGKGVRVAQDVTIHSFSHLEEVHIGASASIGPFARLRGGSIIGEGARIGNFVEGKNLRMGAHSKAAHLSYLGDAVIGADSNIGASVITCNYDGVSKHETHIGKRAFIGSHASLIAPVTIGDGALVGAGSVITKNVTKDHLALARCDQQIEKKRKRKKKNV